MSDERRDASRRSQLTPELDARQRVVHLERRTKRFDTSGADLTPFAPYNYNDNDDGTAHKRTGQFDARQRLVP